MAQNSKSQRPDHELRQQIAHSRDRLARDLEGLRYELDFPLKFRKSFQRKTAVWLAAAIVVGLIITVRPPRKKIVIEPKKAKKENEAEETKKGIFGAGLAVAMGKVVGSIVRPLVISYATKKLGSMVDPKAAERRM